MKCQYLKEKSCPILKNDLDNIHICNGYTCEKPVYVYIVRCKDGTYYTGFTRNLEKRINQHKTGKGSKWCKSHGVREYTYIQCSNAGDGMEIERRIKKWNTIKKAQLFALYGTYR